MTPPRLVQLDIYRTAIPMRHFRHAAAARDLAEAIVVRLETSDGAAGWGETLPRPYVTGETLETVPRDIERAIWPAALAGDREGKSLPATDAGRSVTAARCAVELAMIDLTRRRVPATYRPPVRFGGVLGSADPARTARQLRLMRWFGLRDFKLKLGLGEDVDAENLRVVDRRIGRAVRLGRCTLRVDVNGAWPADQTPQRVAALRPYGVCVVEQPASAPPAGLIDLAQRCDLPLMADESLVTAADAEAFIRGPGRKVWLNVRLSKNGGIAPALHIARAAAQAGVPLVLGCMVGESGILSAAQRAMLVELRPDAWPRFLEGNYGRFLLADDLVRPGVRFGYGGKWRPLGGPGLGVKVAPGRLARYGTLLKTLRAD